MYKIIIKKPAEKFLAKLSRKTADIIVLKIYSLKDNPRPHGCRKLVGGVNKYRIRVRNYRVIYSIFDDILLVEVIKIGQRQDVYK